MLHRDDQLNKIVVELTETTGNAFTVTVLAAVLKHPVNVFVPVTV